ncbi:uncharacterized protein LOC117317517 [Pecten maximus]|uniref:uncharacterized protein LOC117317517 n=1 Tax=Pecten maximus TaxID=6579 RepID=UPI00145816D8|nr:uncharacterized protein LOC117317517 [Pecten maximus]
MDTKVAPKWHESGPPAAKKPTTERDRNQIRAKEMVISTHKRIYKTQEESEAAFINCNVDPVPNSIEWKRDKRSPPETRVLIDNNKYFSGVEAPTLVIKNPNKLVDEGYYQCTAEANGKSVYGDVVQLKVFAVEPGVSRANTIIPSHSSLTEHELNQPTPAMHASVDQGSQMSFKIPEDIDLNRQKSKEDVSDVFERVTHAKKRAKTGEFGKGSVIICIDISPASNSSEPSSLHLAEEFKHYLLDGGTIQLTDESQTVLHVDKEASFKITPQTAAKDSFPYVNISHGEFTVPIEKTAIIQTYVIASPEATPIQWYKVEEDNRIPIEIDNERYFAGSIISPTLIIRETNTDDQGWYQCSATNSKGTG